MKWLDKGGADTSLLQLRMYNNNYRGLHATQDIQKGDIIVCVPRHQLITLEMAWQSDFGKQVEKIKLFNKLKSIKHLLLAMYCINDTRKP